MEPSELLRHVVATLERLGLRYLVTGSIATVFYGEPRFTNDIDVVVTLPTEHIRELCRAFPAPDYYVDEASVRSAVRERGQFNIIHPESGLKVDIIIAQDSAFERSRFGRARRLKPEADYEAVFASPEDAIIKKMEYYRAGASEKHLRDIAGVLRISGEQIDHDYIRAWSARLGLTSLWEALLARTRQDQ